MLREQKKGKQKDIGRAVWQPENAAYTLIGRQ